MNTQRTGGGSITIGLPKGRFELIGKDGRCYGIFKNATQAALTAGSIFPDEEQDPDGTGNGWDVRIIR